MDNQFVGGEYVAVKALENNVQIIGLTRGDGTKPQHTESINKNEVLLVQFTENISAMKIRGKATVLTKYGQLTCGEE
ncbi:MAG: trp RNA-binding attenuation protein MtrB [Christensenellales bacterium]